MKKKKTLKSRKDPLDLHTHATATPADSLRSLREVSCRLCHYTGTGNISKDKPVESLVCPKCGHNTMDKIPNDHN